MKKIAVCGKGGVGKSFIIYSLAQVFKKKGLNVCIVDTDESNMGLTDMFGIKQAPLALMDYLGGKKLLQQNMMKRFSSGDKEVKISVIEKDNFFLDDIDGRYIAKQDYLRLITIGKINFPLEGCACPMAAISREFLEKVKLKENEILLVDTEAGIEHFGRGVEKGIDTIFAIAEPTKESLAVAKKVLDLASVMEKKYHLIINKVNSQEVEMKIIKIATSMGIPLTGIIHYDEEVFNSSLTGIEITSSKAIEELENIINNIVQKEN